MTTDDFYLRIGILLENLQKGTKKIPMPKRTVVSNELVALLLKNDELREVGIHVS